ncbi:MAG: HPr family phosphocarrier protein [Xanthomonadales bacterium]|nr:HPr family phosphocarrier protein [Xanthomonadales bacterium]
MREEVIDVVNRLGLHARAASKLVQLLGSFQSKAWLIRGSREVNAKSIMGVMLLAAAKGTTVTLRLDGPDEDAAISAAIDLFQRRFDEAD